MQNIYVHKDDIAIIVLSKDHHKGIVVQLAVFVDQLAPNNQNELINHRKLSVISSTTVPVTTPSLKNVVAQEIQKAQALLADIHQSHRTLDGVLTDYKSAYKDINEPEKQ